MPANRLHFSPAGARSRTVVSSVVSRPKGKDAPRPSLAGPGREYPPGYPNIIYPNQGTWLWNKAYPKSSLKAAPAPPVAGQPATVDQSHSAAAWILNLIEITHWVSFPIGFLVTFILFDKALVIAPHVDNSNLRVFCLLLGLLSQVYGGGISGNMMHKYEGWQVAPFRNPLDSGTQKYHVSDFNNAWLRSVAYEMLFAFQTLGLTLFNLGVFGFQKWNVALAAVSLFIAFVGPREPRVFLTNPFYKNEQPIFPLPAATLVAFVVTAIVNIIAYVALFSEAFSFPWPISTVVSLIPPLLIGFGGIWEGLVAESTFNQWQHELAFLGLNTGLLLVGVMFWQLVTI